MATETTIYDPDSDDSKTVPTHTPKLGESVFATAERLGVRVLGRREAHEWTDVVCVIVEEANGLPTSYCVAA